MLFDLSGKRRRLIQVVYACLAILMGGSLVMFGIGSDAPGGILDGLGITDSGGGANNPQYEQSIKEAEERLEVDPNDQDALLELARYHYLSATTGIVSDPETGMREISQDARSEIEDALSAWDRYLETDPQQPDPSVAITIAQLHELEFSEALGRTDPAAALASAEAIADAYRIATRGGEGSAPQYGSMARYLYISGQNEKGAKALGQAVAAADVDDPKELERNLKDQAKEARDLHSQLQEVLEAGDEGTGAIEDPFGGLGQSPLQGP